MPAKIKLTLNSKPTSIKLTLGDGSSSRPRPTIKLTHGDEDGDEPIDDHQDEEYVDDFDDEDYEDMPKKSVKRKRPSVGGSKVSSSTKNRLSSTLSSKSSKVGGSMFTSYTSQDSSKQVNLLEDDFFFQDYSQELTMKSDHIKRPCWITSKMDIDTNGRKMAAFFIYVEKFSPIYQRAADFLVAIAEPESRPEYIQTYKITEDSLYSAVAISIDAESIIRVLHGLCKHNLPQALIDFIRETTKPFGKAKIVLKDNRYFIESKYPDILNKLRAYPVIAAAHDRDSDIANVTAEGFVVDEGLQENIKNLDYMALAREKLDTEADDDEMDDELHEEKRFQTVSFMIRRLAVQQVKVCAKNAGYPLMEEYDFKKDSKNPQLKMDLRPSTHIRPYQEKSLSKMFGNGRARSGIIVLPCGAGKSLTGVTAAATIKKSCVVMCINNASVRQWKDQFKMYTDIDESLIRMFTSDAKDILPSKDTACIVITTYSMLCHSGKRSRSGEEMIQSIAGREWGLLVLDEVHVAPAEMFKKVVDRVNAHTKLGLTATLVREDNKIPELGFLVGPKLYEANWIDLTNQGYLAKVLCKEIWCPMTKEFYSEYIKHAVPTGARVQRMLYTLNPCKFRACEYLVQKHKALQHKIIIFSDDVPALVLYCELLGSVPYIYGGTKENERKVILETFKTGNALSCIGLSKVGDTALDIPEANVIIQVSSHFGARRQEAQRLGRILRQKPNPTGDFNAFFYSLISTDTSDMYFSTKRQQYLVDQGYTFHVDRETSKVAEVESTKLASKVMENNLLERVLSRESMENMASLDDTENKMIDQLDNGEIDVAEASEDAAPNATIVKRSSRNMSEMAGGTGILYEETQ